MLSYDDMEPIEVAVSIFDEHKFKHECTDEETVHALVPGKWGHASFMVWHDYDNGFVNFFVAFDNLKISKRKTTAVLKVINQLNVHLQIGTISYSEIDKRIQYKYAVPTDNNDYIDPGVIEKVVITALASIATVQFQCMMVASGACTFDQIGEMTRIHMTTGTA